MFHLSAEALYEDKFYSISKGVIDFDKNMDSLREKFEEDKEVKKFSRFKGYLFEGNIYLDNPGAHFFVDKETSKIWRSKNWI